MIKQGLNFPYPANTPVFVLSVIISCSIRVPEDTRNYIQNFLMLSFLVYQCNLRFYFWKIEPGHLFHLQVVCVCEYCVFSSSQAVIEHLSSNSIFWIGGFGNKWKEEKMIFHCHDSRWLKEKKYILLINHNDGITHLDLDILEYEVKWALGSITTNKASGGDGIPANLFKILKVSAAKVLYSICQQIWKTLQWPQDWKRWLFSPIPKKSNAKECSSYHTIAIISHASKVNAQKSFKLGSAVHDPRTSRFQTSWVSKRQRNQRSNCQHLWIIAREFKKKMYCFFIDYIKAFDCVDHNKLWKNS